MGFESAKEEILISEMFAPCSFTACLINEWTLMRESDISRLIFYNITIHNGETHQESPKRLLSTRVAFYTDFSTPRITFEKASMNPANKSADIYL